LANAKRDGNDFVMNLDEDEFLVSDDFDTIASMFVNNQTNAVTFPIFGMDYRLCSGVSLHFESLGYQSVRPIRTNFTDDETKDYYTDPLIGCSGNRKYIVRTDRWDHLRSHT
jgi:hypothetical protein